MQCPDLSSFRRCNPNRVCTHIILFLLCGVFSGIAYGQEPQAPPVDKRVTRGRAFVTLTFSLDQRRAENENRLVQQVVDQDRVNFNIKTYGGYVLRDNLALGLGLQFDRQDEDRTYLEDGNEVTSRFLSHAYTFGPIMRNYVPLGNGTLQIVIQTDLQFTVEESLQRLFRQADIDKIEGDAFQASLGVKPGAVLFFDRHWAFEVAVGLAGLSSRVETKTFNDDEENETRIIRNNIDLQINLLALDLGVAYYF